jgi:ABC-2 type transport system permease protein
MSQASGERGVAMELPPSETRSESIYLTRLIGGFLGLFAVTLGVASIIASKYGRGLFGSDWGYLFSIVGVALLLFHAIRDTDLEVRRVYGVLAAVLLLLAVGVGVFPAKPDGSTNAIAGQLLVPWGAIFGLLSLLFLVPFARNETAEPYQSWAQIVLLGTGGLLCLGSVLIAIVDPEKMAGPGAVLGILGLGFLCGYFTVTDSTIGLPYQVAVGLGILGAVAIAYAVGRTIFPTILFDGPTALKTVNRTWNWWAVFARLLLIGGGLSALLAFRSRTMPLALKVGLATAGAIFAAVMIVGSFSSLLTAAPKPFLVPGGLILGLLGLLFLMVSLGLVSDSQVVVLTRRELSSYFYSPIAYVVLVGNAIIAGVCYWAFVESLFGGEVDGRPYPEPILLNNWAFTIGAAFTAPILVAAITMRSFSEEKRTGTFEVLLTAPVDEWSIVLGKFVAALFFFMLCWVPAGLHLIALRYVGGVPFDYRPLLSYYVAMLACGVCFISFGLFISSLTKNQIVAAVFTFAGLFSMFVVALLSNQFDSTLGPNSRAILAKFDYYRLWITSLKGQLQLPEVMIQLSLGLFWLFLTTRVLAARRWN